MCVCVCMCQLSELLATVILIRVVLKRACLQGNSKRRMSAERGVSARCGGCGRRLSVRWDRQHAGGEHTGAYVSICNRFVPSRRQHLTELGQQRQCEPSCTLPVVSPIVTLRRRHRCTATQRCRSLTSLASSRRLPCGAFRTSVLCEHGPCSTTVSVTHLILAALSTSTKCTPSSA
jgi:hypothetical protein